jgi:alpha-glucosidase (family GH31 glycosyl hydrolase)
MFPRTFGTALFASAMMLVGRSAPASGQPAATDAGSSAAFDVAFEHGHLHVALVGGNIAQVSFRDGDGGSAPTLVVDPAWHPAVFTGFHRSDDAGAITLSTPAMRVRWDKAAKELSIEDGVGRVLLRQTAAESLRRGELHLGHAAGEAVYGISGYDAVEDASAGLLRHGRQVARAGEQGHAGAPFAWSTAGYGVLLDADGASFDLHDDGIDAKASQTAPLTYYAFVGTPAEIFDALATVSGRAPLFPKWAMGFTNSQWGIDQKELLDIVDTYRKKHIPLDNFTLDFDWKAWGEDDYGEFRWNAKKFPGGPNGKLKAELDRRGVHLTGIMKPRVHVDTVEGRYATAHDLWLPAEKASDDYFSHKPVKDIDFDKPAARAWFFNDALKRSFDTGIVGWWNDEADTTKSNTQFLNMQRSLYDGQRACSDLRVWSINRNFWLGAQRYAYGLWSGDIDTGFASMAAQRARMLSAIDVGEMKWGMDGGGFKGRPSDENYARWIQFGAFTPIFRVHGTFDEKRQPWRYGATAEKAATAAIRLRYALIPYIYAYEHQATARGVGLVRPLPFAFPHDAKVRNDVEAWMFGDWLLVSPVVEQGQTKKHVYLPAGEWIDWWSGKHYTGSREIELVIDAKHWSDIPLFIREGAIIPMQPPMDYVGQKPLTEVAVEVFPDLVRSSFEYYDDDGTSYAYEHGAWYSQVLAVRRNGDNVRFSVAAPSGSYRPALTHYLAKIHGGAARVVTRDGKPLPRAADGHALTTGDGEGWTTGEDRYGAFTLLRLAAGHAQDVALTLAD